MRESHGKIKMQFVFGNKKYIKINLLSRQFSGFIFSKGRILKQSVFILSVLRISVTLFKHWLHWAGLHYVAAV